MPEPTPARSEGWVVDASVLVDLALLRTGWPRIAMHLKGRALHAPAHVDVEVMSALARLGRAGAITSTEARTALERFRSGPIQRHLLPDLLAGAWSRVDHLRVTDALYVELAEVLGLRVLTTDARLARATSLALVVE